MADRVRFGILGGGRMGRLHGKNLAFRIPGAEVAAVSDPVEEAARECARECGCGVYHTDARPVLEDPDIDAVLICSYTDQHAAQIISAARAGKHIFCEKPIALGITQIDQALAEVAKSGVKLQIGFNRRFDPGFSRAHDMVVDGKIGTPHLVRITSRDPGLAPMEYVETSGGIYVDMTIHDFDMARWIIGSEVEEVYAMGNVLVEPRLRDLGDVDTTIVMLRYYSGALGAIDNSREAVYGYDQRLEIFGSGGCVVVGNPGPTTAVLTDREGVHADKPLYFFVERYEQSYLNEMNHFVDCVQNDRAPAVKGIDGRIPVVMGMAAGRSQRENRPIRVDLDLRR
jgi:myo-inositol 2-dehydrogenase/D-chiro-inositol 1-dehydrogenase